MIRTRRENIRKMHTVLLASVAFCLIGLAGAPAFGQADVMDGADPDRPWAADADELLADGRVEAALRAYRELTAEYDDDWGLWLRISLAELRLGNGAAALDASERAVEKGPDEVDPYFMLAQVEATMGDADGAMETIGEALARYPEDLDVLRTGASMAIELQRWPMAVGLLRQLIRIEPDRADYRLDLGRILLTQGDFDAAIDVFEDAASRGADAATCRALVGKSHLAAGRTDRAIAAFEASNAARANGDAYGGLATVHSLRGERGKSIQAFRKAIEFTPNDPDLHYNLGNVLAQSDRLEEAEEAFRRVIAIDPQAVQARTNLAVLLLNRFAVSEAEQHLRLAVQLDPSIASAHLHLGRIAGARYAFEEAIGHYRRYRQRVRDPREAERIAGVLEQLRERAAESAAALAQGKVHLLQIMVSSADEARSVIGRVRQGEDFYVIAHRESLLADSAGVDVGFIEVDSIAEAFRDPVRRLQVGDVTPPIETERGVYVFKRVE